MIRALIFDFDGVILESADLKTKAFQALFEEICPAHVQEALTYHRANMGISRFVKFRHIFKNFLKQPLTSEKEKQLGVRFAKIVLDQLLKVSFVPGSLEFLRAYQGRYRMFVASGTPEDELLEIAEKRGVKELFREIHGSPRSKQEIIESIITDHNFKKEETVFVGDAESDYAAASATGVHFVARKSGENLKNLDCRYWVKDMSELETVLKKISAEGK